MSCSPEDFDDFRQAFIGQDVSHVWRGYGSALFVEFGVLRASAAERPDGSQGNPKASFA